jgi:hypothetical protein
MMIAASYSRTQFAPSRSTKALIQPPDRSQILHVTCSLAIHNNPNLHINACNKILELLSDGIAFFRL